MNKSKIKKIIFALSLIFIGSNVYSQDFVYDWVRSAGGERWDLANDIVIDDDKNVYMAGGFEQTAFFGSDSLVSAGERDVFIAKYDSLGTLVWLKSAGGKKYDNVIDMEIDSENNLLLTGNFQDTSYFEGQEIIARGYMNNFIAKYSSDGNLIQLKSINVDSRANKLFITLTNNNDFFLSGTYYEQMSIDYDTINAEGKTNMFIARFSNDFISISLMNISGFADNILKDIKYFDDRFFIICEFTDSIEINNYKYWSYGSTDALMLKADTAGNILNVKHFAGFGKDNASSLIIDADSSIYISAEFESKLYFDEDSLISEGGKDLLLMKTDKDFNTIWYRQIGSTTDEYANTLLKNTVNAVYLTGSFIDSLAIENRSIVSEDMTADMFMAKFMPDGENIGLKQAGGSGNEYNNVVVNDPDNYLYIIGNFSYNFAFETDSISSDSIFEANKEDIFIARFYDCDYARYPEIGNDTTYCGYGTLEVLNPESTGGGIFGRYNNYYWNNGQSGKQIIVYDSGYYSVTTIDNHKCLVKSDSIFIAVYPEAQPDLGADIEAIPGEIIELFGGYFEEYFWSNDSVTESIFISTDTLPEYTNYISLTATNEYDCTAEDEVIIYVEGASNSPGGGNQNTGTYNNNEDGGENHDSESVRPFQTVRRVFGTQTDHQTDNETIKTFAGIGGKNIIQISSLVYPNPNRGHFFINISKINEEIQNIRIYTAEGRRVYEENNISSDRFEINLKSKGAHYIIAETLNNLFFEKIIIE